MSEVPDQDHDGLQHRPPPTPIERRAAALEALLTEKGLVPDGFIEEVNRIYENDIGPMNGAKVVARAWVDPDFKARLLAGRHHRIGRARHRTNGRIVVVANEPGSHNVVVCTLCSCYPWPVLGLPPTWYKEPAYRARMVREPRVVLEEMGCDARRRHRDPCLGQLRRGALPRPAGAPAGHRGSFGGGAWCSSSPATR